MLEYTSDHLRFQIFLGEAPQTHTSEAPSGLDNTMPFLLGSLLFKIQGPPLLVHILGMCTLSQPGHNFVLQLHTVTRFSGLSYYAYTSPKEPEIQRGDSLATCVVYTLSIGSHCPVESL